MSIFSFIKDVGQKLMGHEAHAATGAAPQSDPMAMASKLLEQIKGMNLGIDNPQIRVEGDKAVIEGNAGSQEALEKAILAIGNTNGIASVESKVQTASAGQQSQFYTVKSGDTLSKISKEVYGNANRYNEILEANRPMLKDADHIYPGQQLRIPQDQKKAA